MSKHPTKVYAQSRYNFCRCLWRESLTEYLYSVKYRDRATVFYSQSVKMESLCRKRTAQNNFKRWCRCLSWTKLVPSGRWGWTPSAFFYDKHKLWVWSLTMCFSFPVSFSQIRPPSRDSLIGTSRPVVLKSAQSQCIYLISQSLLQLSHVTRTRRYRVGIWSLGFGSWIVLAPKIC